MIATANAFPRSWELEFVIQRVLYNGRTNPYSDIYIKFSKSIAVINSSKLQSKGPIWSPDVTVVSSPKMLKSSINNDLDLLVQLIGYNFFSEGIVHCNKMVVYIQKGALMAEGYKVISNQLSRFSYRELNKAIRGFKEELGRGGSGFVYKGVLDNGMVVAVKKLENVSLWRIVYLIRHCLMEMNAWLERKDSNCSWGGKRIGLSSLFLF